MTSSIFFAICFVLTAVGAVPLATSAATSDVWFIMSHQDPFPSGVVQALNRPLENNDPKTAVSFVALLQFVEDGGYAGPPGRASVKPVKSANGTVSVQDYRDEAYEVTFGRSVNNNGKAEASFPYDNLELRSRGQMFFNLLLDNQAYNWVRVKDLDESKCQRVHILGKGARDGTPRDYSPVVLNVQIGSFSGEILGKGDFIQKEAWAAHNSKESKFNGDTFENAFVLCRKSD